MILTPDSTVFIFWTIHSGGYHCACVVVREREVDVLDLAGGLHNMEPHAFRGGIVGEEDSGNSTEIGECVLVRSQPRWPLLMEKLFADTMPEYGIHATKTETSVILLLDGTTSATFGVAQATNIP